MSLLLLVATALPPAAAQEAEMFGFPPADSPCIRTDEGTRCGHGFACWSIEGRLSCRLLGAVTLRPDWTRGCELNSGPTFMLRATGRAVRGCDEIVTREDAPRLAPGGTWQRAGTRCENRTGTLHCINRAGHGFRIHPRRQEVF